MLPLTRCAAVALAALLATSCDRSTRDHALRTIKVYDLLEAFPDATKQVHDSKYVNLGEFAVANETRRAMYLHPSGSVEFPMVHLSSKAVLSFCIGIDDQAWDKAGDGVQFTIFVSRANDARTKVFSRYVDPKHNPDDRRWIEGRTSLKAFRNEDVRIILVTDSGPRNDFNYDWALWGEPQILLNDEQNGSPK